MKKSLVLAMAMPLGVTASAYAANPFSDVPAGHWAYDSISKLAAAGVIEGYGDATFGGDKLMTRYEMAQIVAKAMAKGANVDKLAAEFADELDNLGVRVANLEKKADNVKITGQARFRYQSHDTKDGDDAGDLRTRIWVNGQINEDWAYTGLIENLTEFDNNESEETDVRLRRAWVDGRVGGLAVTAGRYNEMPNNGSVLDVDADGVKVSYGDKVKVWGAALKAAGKSVTVESGDRIYVAGLASKIGVVDAYANYFKASDAAYTVDDESNPLSNGDKEVYNVGLNFDVAKDLNLAYEYMWGDKKYDDRVSKDGFVATLAYKGADAATPGTWGAHVTYYDQPINAVFAPTYDATQFMDQGGYKGWNIGVDYALAKNITLAVNYYDTEAKVGSEDDQAIFTELFFAF